MASTGDVDGVLQSTIGERTEHERVNVRGGVRNESEGTEVCRARRRAIQSNREKQREREREQHRESNKTVI
jgi:hypothetical protein